MKDLTAFRPRNGLFNFVLFFTAIHFVLVWLPLLRCTFDGASYSWGQSFYGLSVASSGIQIGLLFLVISLIFYLALFYAFYWMENRKVFYALLAGWWLLGFGNLLFELLVNGDIMFHGDTLDVHVSLAAVITPIALLALVLLILVIRKDKTLSPTETPWGKSNRLAAWIILSPLPIQALLFATGEPHGTTDEIAVVITILQSLLLPIIFIPKKTVGG